MNINDRIPVKRLKLGQRVQSIYQLMDQPDTETHLVGTVTYWNCKGVNIVLPNGSCAIVPRETLYRVSKYLFQRRATEMLVEDHLTRIFAELLDLPIPDELVQTAPDLSGKG